MVIAIHHGYRYGYRSYRYGYRTVIVAHGYRTVTVALMRKMVLRNFI